MLIGSAKRNNKMHVKMMKSTKGEDEEAQLACSGKKITGEMVADHAIGLVVDVGQKNSIMWEA